MDYYINEQEIVIKAEKKYYDELFRDDEYLLASPITGNKATIPAETFEKYFKPITDSRVRIVEQLKKYMLLKLKEHQIKGDEWKKVSVSKLLDRLQEEVDELEKAIYEDDAPGFENVLGECGDVAIRLAMILDKFIKEGK